MATPKYLDFVANAGRFASFLTLLVKFAKKYELTDEEFAKLATDEGEPLIEAFVLSLKTPKQTVQLSHAKPVSHISRRSILLVDRETPLEVQFAELAEKGKIEDGWWRGFTSEQYAAYKSRPSTIVLGECHFGVHFNCGEAVDKALKMELGVVRSADPYELCAWIRHMSQDGLMWPLAAFDRPSTISSSSSWGVPTARKVDDEPQSVMRAREYRLEWQKIWIFLVVCVPE